MRARRPIIAAIAAALFTGGLLAAASPARAVEPCVDPLAYHLFGAHAYGAGWAENSRVWASDASTCKYYGDYYVWTAGSGTRYQGIIYFNLPR